MKKNVSVYYIYIPYKIISILQGRNLINATFINSQIPVIIRDYHDYKGVSKKNNGNANPPPPPLRSLWIIELPEVNFEIKSERGGMDFYSFFFCTYVSYVCML